MLPSILSAIGSSKMLMLDCMVDESNAAASWPTRVVLLYAVNLPEQSRESAWHDLRFTRRRCNHKQLDTVSVSKYNSNRNVSIQSPSKRGIIQYTINLQNQVHTKRHRRSLHPGGTSIRTENHHDQLHEMRQVGKRCHIIRRAESENPTKVETANSEKRTYRELWDSDRYLEVETDKQVNSRRWITLMYSRRQVKPLHRRFHFRKCVDSGFA